MSSMWKLENSTFMLQRRIPKFCYTPLCIYIYPVDFANLYLPATIQSVFMSVIVDVQIIFF
jgi:hypothetical protein